MFNKLRGPLEAFFVIPFAITTSYPPMALLGQVDASAALTAVTTAAVRGPPGRSYECMAGAPHVLQPGSTDGSDLREPGVRNLVSPCVHVRP